MTKPLYKTGYSTYGGSLTHFDFDGHHTMKTMADKIMKDINFDKQCKRNSELRNRAKKSEELKNEKHN